jgi:hypothetical protein
MRWLSKRAVASVGGIRASVELRLIGPMTRTSDKQDKPNILRRINFRIVKFGVTYSRVVQFLVFVKLAHRILVRVPSFV